MAVKEKRPNILFLMTDQQRHDALGCMNPAVRTSALAAAAVLGLAAFAAPAATLDATTNLNTNPPIPLASSAVQTNAAGVYDFGDKNGDGTRDDPVAPAGLDFGARKLYITNGTLTTKGTPIKLALNGGDMSGYVTNLNLSKVRYAVFDAGGVSYVNGVLTGTNGAPVASLDDIGTALRCPADQQVRYWKDQNPALGGNPIILADENGTPGAGGRLRGWPSSGTVVTFK